MKQATTKNRPDLDDAIRHLESVHRVIVARERNAKIIPFPVQPSGLYPVLQR